MYVLTFANYNLATKNIFTSIEDVFEFIKTEREYLVNSNNSINILNIQHRQVYDLDIYAVHIEYELLPYKIKLEKDLNILKVKPYLKKDLNE